MSADVVIWDSHPLALGATPTQVYVDGIPQLHEPHTLSKPASFQVLPKTPNFDEEAAKTVEFEGLPPLRSHKTKDALFTNVKSVFLRDNIGGRSKIVKVDDEIIPSHQNSVVLVVDGQIACIGRDDCIKSFNESSHNVPIVDLEGGMLLPALTSFGSPLGLVEIRLESSTNDGVTFDPLTTIIPSVLGDETIIQAKDGLQFEGRNTL